MERKSFVRLYYVLGFVAFGALVFIPSWLDLSPAVRLATFAVACVVALLATTIRCENCQTSIFKFPPSYVWIFSKRCPDCGTERV